MANVSITAANVQPGADSKKVDYTSGATITQGQIVAVSASSVGVLADADSATAETRSPKGFALNSCVSGQPVTVHTKGLLTVGGTLVKGTAYCLSPTAGALMPVADLASGDYRVFMGWATSTTVLDVQIREAGVTA